MNRKIILAGSLLIFQAGSVRAQQDSTPVKNILLREVTIQARQEIRNGTVKNQPSGLLISTDKILESISGVSMVKRGNFAQEPTIRGLSAGQINVMIDGMPVFGACTDRMDPASSYIEPNNLQSVSVNYGPGEMAANSSIGGGFNFRLKQPVLNAPKKWSGMAGIGYESNGNGLQTLGALQYSSKTWAVNMNGIFRRSENYKAGGGETIRFSQYEKWNGGISAKKQIGEHHFLNFNYIQDEGYDIGYPALLMDVAFAKAKIASASHVYVCNHRHLKRWETKAFYNFINHAMDDTKRPEEQVPVHMDMPGTSQTAGFFSEAKWQMEKHQVKAKLNGYQNRLHASMTMYPDNAAEMYMLTIPDAQRDVLGIEASDAYQVMPDFTIHLGARAEYAGSSIYSAEGEKILSGIAREPLDKNTLLYTFHINPVYALKKNWLIHLNLARGMREASLQELYGFYLFNRVDAYDYLGNAGLKKETSWNLSMGTHVEAGRIKFDAQAFTYFIRDYITGLPRRDFSVMTIGARGVKQYDNLPSARISGLEAGAEVVVFKKLSFASSNTWNYGQDAAGRALPWIAPFKSVNNICFAANGYQLNATGILAAAQNRVSTEFYGETSTPGYGIINLKADKDFRLGRDLLSVSLGVNNLFDSRYYEHLSVFKIPQPGRNFTAHLVWKF